MKHSLSKYQPQIDQIAKNNNITYLGLFGSYARGEQTHKSDVDLLVNFSKRLSLLDLIDTEEQLSHALNAPVDLVPSDSLNKHVKPFIAKDLVTIYGQK